MSRRISLDGKIREFPDDATDDEIAAVLGGARAPRLARGGSTYTPPPSTAPVGPRRARGASTRAPQPEEASTAAGAFVRHAGRGAAPAIGGAGGFAAGATLAGTLSSPAEAIPVAGTLVHGGLTLAGGLAGAFAGASGVSKAQDWIMSKLPTSVVRALGQDEAQRQADEAAHPYASFAGDLAPMALTMRPGVVPARALPQGASKLTRIMSTQAGSHAAGAALGGGMEAGNEAFSDQRFDPWKVALATGAGAALNRPTSVGDAVMSRASKATIIGMQVAARNAGRAWGNVRPQPVAEPDFANMRNVTPDAPAQLPAPQQRLPAPIEQPRAAEPVARAAPVEPAPRVINIDGTTHEFPEGTTDDEIVAALSTDTPAPVASVPEPAQATSLPPVPVAEPQPVDGGPAAAGVDGLRGAAGPAAPQPNERTVSTPGGDDIRVRTEVVPAASLLAAEGQLQNRDRSRETTALQVQDIVSKFRPSWLGDDNFTDRGAPVVGPDNTIESGNGRMMALNRIYGEPEHGAKAQAYRDFIESQGHSTEGIENPVLIRRRVSDATEEQRRKLVIDSNKNDKMAMSPVETARGDADNITPDMLESYVGGDLNSTGNARLVAAFNKGLLPTELNGMIGEDRRLTATGKQRIENALVARAYDNPKLLARIMESSNDDIRSISGSMADVSVPWAKMRADAASGEIDPKYDITDQLADAAARTSDARKTGTKPTDVLSQSDAFDQIDPLTSELIRSFHNPGMTRAASRKAVTQFLSDYIAAARAEKATEGLFGPEPARPPIDILRELLASRDAPSGQDMFAAAEDAPTKGPTNAEADGYPQRDEGRDQGVDRQEEEGARRRGEGRASDVAQEGSRRGKSGGLKDAPSFEAASYTQRASIYDSAAVALGMEPDAFKLLAAPRQVTLLRGLMDKTFGIKMDVDRGLQERFAIDQMLDAYQNVSGMAHVLGLPARAIGFDGKLTLRLQKGGKFLGVFYPQKNAIALPKRSNSFAHEWGHALDYWLMDHLTPEIGRGLSGAVRKGGGSIIDEPKSVGDAFVRMLNAMFFDKADVAAKIMALEAKIAATQSDKVRADAQQAIDKLKGGNSQIRDSRSSFYKESRAFGARNGGGDYWQSPTEMMARAFEAYVSYRAELSGLGTEMIGKGDAAYLSKADDRLASTFPKQEERNDIFDAFNDVFEQIAKEQIIAAGPAAEHPGLGKSTPLSPEKRKGNRIQRMIDNEIGPLKDARTSREKFVEGRATSGRGIWRKTRDVAGYFAYGMTAELRAIGKINNSPTIAKLHTMLEWETGKGKTRQGRGFIQAARMREANLLNRVNKAYADYAPRDGKSARPRELTKAEDKQLRDLLISEDAPGASPQMRRLAAELRSIEDDTFHLLQKAGIDVGYTRNGHLMRMLDMGIIANDGDGFKAAAGEVYGIMFDREFPADPAELTKADKMDDFLALARRAAKTDSAIADALSALKAAMKDLKKAEEAIAGAGDPASLKAKIPALNDAIEKALAELHPLLRASVSEFNAQAWATRLGEAAPYEFDNSGPSADFLKKRVMPPEADKILEKYYINEPRQVVETYLSKAAKRIEYAERFGHDNAKINQMLKDMAAEGVPKIDVDTVKKIFDLATGRGSADMAHPSVNNAMSMIRFVYGTAALLPRATFSSLSEALTAGIIMGNAKYGLKAFGSMVGQIMHTASAAERREIARIAGFVHEAGGSQVMAERFGGSVDETRWDRLATKMFHNSGLTWLTKMQHTGMIAPAHAFLESLARGYLNGTPNGKKEAIARYNELGITDAEAFAKRIVADGKLPSPGELESAVLDPGRFQYAHDWMTAVGRMKSQVVQEPSAMSRPRAASTAVGQFAYGIMSFNYEQWRNVVRGEMNRAWERAQRSGAAFSGAHIAFGLMPSLAMVAIGAIIVSTVREITTNYARFKERLNDGTLASSMISLGIQRAFGTPFDPVIQAIGGTKYNRAPFLQLLGPTFANIGQNTTDILKQFTGNTRTTNTSEHNATRGAYRMISPWGVAALSSVPGGPIMSGAAGMLAGTITSPQAGETAGDLAFGKKNGTKVGGKKLKSGPSWVDSGLDRAFGAVPANKKASSNPYQ